jgi:hypothetical protein
METKTLNNVNVDDDHSEIWMASTMSVDLKLTLMFVVPVRPPTGMQSCYESGKVTKPIGMVDPINQPQSWTLPTRMITLQEVMT